jgi:hypothetical protein
MQLASSFTIILFNYTPLVTRVTDKNKQLTIAKPMQTGINRKKYTLLELANVKLNCKYLISSI